MAIFNEYTVSCSTVCNWAVPFVTGVSYFFLSKMINPKKKKKTNSAIQKNRSTLLISLQLPAIEQCLRNKIPFCFLCFLIGAVGLHSFLVTVKYHILMRSNGIWEFVYFIALFLKKNDNPAHLYSHGAWENLEDLRTSLIYRTWAVYL